MYRLKPGIKQDPVRRWHLPDRVFFGHGACQILAGAFLQAPPLPGFHAERILPGAGFAGNHIYVTDGTLAFDFHGYAGRTALLCHHTDGWARLCGPGWHCRVERVAFDLLDRAALNACRMLGPGQYHGDALARARRYLDRIDHPAAAARAMARCERNALRSPRPRARPAGS